MASSRGTRSKAARLMSKSKLTSLYTQSVFLPKSQASHPDTAGCQAPSRPRQRPHSSNSDSAGMGEWRGLRNVRVSG